MTTYHYSENDVHKRIHTAYNSTDYSVNRNVIQKKTELLYKPVS